MPAVTAEGEIKALPAVLHCLPFPGPRGRGLQFHSFDEAYLERLRAGDSATQRHFVSYFSRLIQVKLRSRSASREVIEDAQQETFARFFAALQKGHIRHPERLGSFVNSMCNNILREQYRGVTNDVSLDDDENKAEDPAAHDADALDILQSEEQDTRVREILDELPERDRRLLLEVFLEERDKDQVCLSFGVDRKYLRVLLHRAKNNFKSVFLKAPGRQ
jgi:RNA polymerase sigma-70 factor (ECF subfamily)